MSDAVVPPRPSSVGRRAEDAWQRSLSNERAVWNAPPRNAQSVKMRLRRGLVVPHLEPKFSIAADEVFFCIGSCFARELEERLLIHDLRVDSLSLQVPLEGPVARRTALINKFTTASMLNELLWAFDELPFPENALIAAPEGSYDLQLRPNIAPRENSEVRERRRTVIEYFARLRNADVVVITLGLNEVWFDHHAGLYLNGVPPRTLAEREPERFTVHARTFDETLADLHACRNLLRAHARPGVRIVITVSPIPLLRTFLDEDVLTANGYGKSLLRTAAGMFAEAHDDVSYFGSYEMATVSERSRVFRSDDEIHVYPEAAAEITGAFLRAYGFAATTPHPDFHERTYLRINPDVSEAVGRGEFASGYEHWQLHGRRENRRTTDDHPTAPGGRDRAD